MKHTDIHDMLTGVHIPCGEHEFHFEHPYPEFQVSPCALVALNSHQVWDNPIPLDVQFPIQ
jgi:hypothetical protein